MILSMKYKRLHNFIFLILTFIVGTITTLAEIKNEGFIGDSFYGVTTDPTGTIINRVGPNAEFAVPSKLNARSELTTLLSGEFSKLSVALSLDDGSITRLPPLSVTWGSTSSELIIKDGFVTARDISKSSRESISASVAGLTSVVFIRLKNESLQSNPVTDTIELSKNALSDSISLPQQGWKKSNWFGNYYDGGNDWIHHSNLGWLYTSSNQPNSIWLWSSSQEWLWTGNGVYPHLYRNKDGTWIYFIVEAFPRKIFYNQSTKKLERSE